MNEQIKQIAERLRGLRDVLELTAEDIARDDLAAADVEVGLTDLARGMVFHRVGAALDRFAAAGLQVKALRALEHIVAQIGLLQLLGQEEPGAYFHFVLVGKGYFLGVYRIAFVEIVCIALCDGCVRAEYHKYGCCQN